MMFKLSRKLGFAAFTAVLLIYPLVAQAASPDALIANVSSLSQLCDRVLSAVNPIERDISGSDRADVQPFIDASEVLADYSRGSGLVHRGGWVHGIAIFDANGDGFNDIYITHDNRPILMWPEKVVEMKLGNRLFLNLGPDAEGLPRFVEVGQEAGVQELGRHSKGVAVADYDNDGRLDLYVVNGVDGVITEDEQRVPANHSRTYGALVEGEGHNTLLHNEGNRQLVLPDGSTVEVPLFSDQTDAAGVGDGRESFSAAWADVDNDGFVDLYVANFIDPDFWGVRYPGLPALYHFGERNTLYRNNGDGTFTDITETAGVGGRPRELVHVPVRLRGPVQPERVTDSLGRGVNPGALPTHHAVWFDYDEDGFPDLFTANDYNVIELFHNNGDLTFTDVTDAAGLSIQGAWMEVGIWDYDSDGMIDLYATNLGAGAFARPVVDGDGQVRYTRFNGLFRNEGAKNVRMAGTDVPVPQFRYVSDQVRVDWSDRLPPEGLTMHPTCHDSLTSARGLEFGEFGWGAVFPDIDNDGDQDVYWVGALARADPQSVDLPLNSPGRLLRNEGRGVFTDISVEARVLNLVGVDYATGARMSNRYGEIGSGLAMGDLNNDGFPDLIVSNTADYTPFGHDPSNSLADDEIVEVPTFLFINPGGENSRLKVKLEGTVSNRAGIGTRVRVTLEDGRTLTRFLLSGDVTGGQNALDLLFGLGQSQINTVEVLWPSGIVDVFQGVDINTTLTVVEGQQGSS